MGSLGVFPDFSKYNNSLGKVLHCNFETILSVHSSYKIFANKFASFFCEKICKIQDTFPTSGSSTDALTWAPLLSMPLSPQVKMKSARLSITH